MLRSAILTASRLNSCSTQSIDCSRPAGTAVVAAAFIAARASASLSLVAQDSFVADGYLNGRNLAQMAQSEQQAAGRVARQGFDLQLTRSSRLSREIDRLAAITFPQVGLGEQPMLRHS